MILSWGGFKWRNSYKSVIFYIQVDITNSNTLTKTTTFIIMQHWRMIILFILLCETYFCEVCSPDSEKCSFYFEEENYSYTSVTKCNNNTSCWLGVLCHVIDARRTRRRIGSEVKVKETEDKRRKKRMKQKIIKNRSSWQLIYLFEVVRWLFIKCMLLAYTCIYVVCVWHV